MAPNEISDRTNTPQPLSHAEHHAYSPTTQHHSPQETTRAAASHTPAAPSTLISVEGFTETHRHPATGQIFHLMSAAYWDSPAVFISGWQVPRPQPGTPGGQFRRVEGAAQTTLSLKSPSVTTSPAVEDAGRFDDAESPGPLIAHRKCEDGGGDASEVGMPGSIAVGNEGELEDAVDADGIAERLQRAVNLDEGQEVRIRRAKASSRKGSGGSLQSETKQYMSHPADARGNAAGHETVHIHPLARDPSDPGSIVHGDSSPDIDPEPLETPATSTLNLPAPSVSPSADMLDATISGCTESDSIATTKSTRPRRSTRPGTPWRRPGAPLQPSDLSIGPIPSPPSTAAIPNPAPSRPAGPADLSEAHEAPLSLRRLSAAPPPADVPGLPRHRSYPGILRTAQTPPPPQPTTMPGRGATASAPPISAVPTGITLPSVLMRQRSLSRLHAAPGPIPPSLIANPKKLAPPLHDISITPGASPAEPNPIPLSEIHGGGTGATGFGRGLGLGRRVSSRRNSPGGFGGYPMTPNGSRGGIEEVNMLGLDLGTADIDASTESRSATPTAVSKAAHPAMKRVAKEKGIAPTSFP